MLCSLIKIENVDLSLSVEYESNSEVYYGFLLEQVSRCSECDSSGPNLWLCLHRGCYKVGCGEAHKDHSTLHNKVGTDACFCNCGG